MLTHKSGRDGSGGLPCVPCGDSTLARLLGPLCRQIVVWVSFPCLECGAHLIVS